MQGSDSTLYARKCYSLTGLWLKELCNAGVPGVFCPIGWSALKKDVPDILPCPTLNQQLNYAVMACPRRLVQRCGMRMDAQRVIATWIFSCIEEKPYNFSLAKLSGQCKGYMPFLRRCLRNQFAGGFKSACRGRSGQTQRRSATMQGFNCRKFSMDQSRQDSPGHARAIVAQQVN